jgi:choice-of-anchor B domain-containing protein
LLDEDAHYPNIHSAHNVVINEETGFAYIVGASGGGMSCGGGLHMVDINEPKNPTFAGCFADPSTGRRGTGYSHDAQCVIYDGPDTEHTGKEICVGANETAISVADVTDKSNPIALSTGSYPDYGYVHQGWFDETQTYFYQNDELDELNGTVEETRTIVWDLTDLDDPQVLTQYFNDNASSDHNLYIRDNLMYQSNYVSGLQVIDISEPENPQRVGFFDTFPFTKDAAGFSGTWSNYPYFNSGVVIMTSGFEGLFILETSPELINR